MIRAAALLLSSLLLATTTATPDAKPLVDAEHAFAKLAADKGVKDAFLANLANESVLFRPRPVDGKKWLNANPATPGVLSWEPAVAEIAATHDLGYTSGPWEFREKAGDKPMRTGQYLTIWRKQAEGGLKVVLDAGVSGPPSAASPVKLTSPAGGKTMKAADASTAARKAEDDFVALASAQGAASAYASVAADDVLVLRAGSPPRTGKKELGEAALAGPKGAITWKRALPILSQAGDLAYTFGTYEAPAAGTNPAEAGTFVRIWRRGASGFRLAVDLMTPIAAPPATASPAPPKKS